MRLLRPHFVRPRNDNMPRKLTYAFFFLLTVVCGLWTNQALAAGITINPGASITLNGSSQITTQDLNIQGTLSAGSGTIALSGNWLNSGVFIPGTSKVNVLGAGISTISGANTFYNLSCTTSGKQINFTAAQKQTITNSFTLTGTSAGRIVLRSTIPGTRWEIDPQASRSVDYVDCQDSYNRNTTAILATNSKDSGNNVNWKFIYPLSGTIKLNNDSTYTNSPLVTLALSAFDSAGGANYAVQMQFSNDNSTWSTPEGYATTKSWTLSSGDGTKTVYVKYKDILGNWSAVYSDTIILDTTPPAQPGINPVTTPTSTNSQTITGTKSADTAVIIITCPTATVGTAAYPTTTTWSYTLINLTQGSNNITVKAKDSAANESSSVAATIVLDTIAPTGTIKLNNDATYANSTLVTLTLSATDSGSGMSSGAQMQFSNDNTTWSTAEAYANSKSWTLSTGNGTKTVYVKFKDVAGNWSAAYSDTIILDTTLPTGTIKLNNGAEYTNSPAVTLTLLAQDNPGGSGLSQMQFSNDGATYTTPEAYASSKSWTLSTGDGTKTVYAKFKDVAGNWSTPVSDTIILDTTPPGIFINPVISPTNQNVILSYSASDNFTSSAKIIISGDNSPYVNEGTYNITLTAQDLAGNSSTKSVSFTIDKTPPLVIITSPQNGAVVENSNLQLQGTVDGLSFSETRTLVEGENILTKTATDSAGNTASISVTVYLYLGEFIGPQGGEVLSSDGKVRVVIPPGALNASKQIRVSALNKEALETAAPTNTALLSVVECKPYDLVFNLPVSIIYTLPQAEIPGTTVELGLYDKVKNKIISTGQTSVVPVDGYTATFSIMHFSTYAALKNLTPQEIPIGLGVKIPLPDMLTGAFSHSVPITIPPGRKGVQPALALSYRSGNSNSWVGLGFSLNPGYIVRSTRLGPPTYIDTQDTFYFITDAGTTELVYLVDNLYQAKVESSFTKFFKESDDTWKVVGKDGSTLRLGQTADSKETSSQGTFSWYLTKVVDTNGNYIEYHYTKNEGKSYLSRIDYTGNEMGLSPTNSVEFSLESRDDIFSNYISSAKISTAKRLKEILVKVNYSLAWRYELEYSLSPDTNRSLLKSITQYGSDGKSLPEQRFSYQKAK